MYSGDIYELINNLTAQGYHHAYVDGGAVITSFINLKLINEMIITKAPMLLGAGIPLFGELNQAIKLTSAKVVAFLNDFVHITHNIDYS